MTFFEFLTQNDFEIQSLNELERTFLEIGFREFFYGKELIFKNVYFTKMCKSEIKNNNKAICSRLSDTVSNKINFKGYDPHGDHPPA